MAHCAVIEASVIPAFSEPAVGSGLDPADGAPADDLSSARRAGAVQPCSDIDRFVQPGAECEKPNEPGGTARRPASESPRAPTADQIIEPFETSAAASAFDFAAGQQTFDSLQPLSAGAAPALLDQLFARPEDTYDSGPLPAGSDVFVSYVVPALAFLALLLTGLLLRELVRRRQRAASARRIRRNFGRSIRRGSAPGGSRTAGDGRRQTSAHQ